jgi:hypothetical protein
MKTVASIALLVVMPLGFFVLAAVIVNRMLVGGRRHLDPIGNARSAGDPSRC